MKKLFLAGIAAMTLVFSMTGCGKSNPSSKNGGGATTFKADHSSADATRRTYIAALEAKDFQTAYNCWTPMRQQKEFGGTLEGFKNYFGDRLPEYIQDLKEHLDRGKPQATRQANGEWLLDD